MSRSRRVPAVLAGLLCAVAWAGEPKDGEHFSILAPAGWESRELPEPAGRVRLTAPLDAATLDVLPLPLDAAASRGAAVDRALALVAPGVPTQLLQERKASVAARGALQRTYRLAPQGKPDQRAVVTVLRTDDAWLVLVARARETAFVDVEPEISKAVASLTLGPETPDQLRAKLKALELARDAAVLTDAEYDAKRLAIEKQLRRLEGPADVALQRKLDALQTAYEAGVLTETEYRRKRAALTGEPIEPPKFEPPPPPRPPRPPEPPRPVEPPKPEPRIKLYRDLRGRYHFRYPRVWAVQDLPRQGGTSLTYRDATANVLLVPWDRPAEKLLETFAAQLQEQTRDYRELRRGAGKVGALDALVLEFDGTGPADVPGRTEVRVHVAGGTGYVFFLFAPQADYAAALPVWHETLESFALGEPPPAAP